MHWSLRMHQHRHRRPSPVEVALWLRALAALAGYPPDIDVETAQLLDDALRAWAAGVEGVTVSVHRGRYKSGRPPQPAEGSGSSEWATSFVTLSRAMPRLDAWLSIRSKCGPLRSAPDPRCPRPHSREALE